MSTLAALLSNGYNVCSVYSATYDRLLGCGTVDGEEQPLSSSETVCRTRRVSCRVGGISRRSGAALKIPALLITVLFFFRPNETFAQCELQEDAKLTASDAAQGEDFGSSVSVSGDVAIVGAIYDDCEGGHICGSGHIYRFNGSTWVEEQKLTPSDRSFDLDHFGNAVSVSGDVAVIGAYLRNCSVGQFCGAAYVYRFNGSTWIQEQKLTAPNAAARDYFGISVSVDGSVIVVGAAGGHCAPSSYCGSAYVYRYNGITWILQLRLTASDAASHDLFGISVTVSEDTVVVGADGDDCAAGINCGSAYVYRFDGSTWVEEQKLSASDEAAYDYFGTSVSASGEVTVVGANGTACASGDYCGSAYVYRFNGSTWVEQGKLTASDAAPDDQFGYSVSVSGDTVVVGAFLKDCAGGQDCGSAYVYRFDGNGWVDQGKLAASDAAPGDQFGHSVAVSGELAVVGAAFDDCGAGLDCGSAYVYTLGNLPFPADCNGNGIDDECDISAGVSRDRDANGIPDECEAGACCDGSTGVCVGDVSMALCAGDQRSWSVNTPCNELDPPCTAHSGACCDLLTGGCAENILPSACSGAQRRWTKGATCSAVGCEAVTGACCDHDPFGGCTDGLTRAECNCTRCEWTKLALCNDMGCPHDSIPTVGGWGLAILALLLITGAKVRFGRIQQT